MNLLYQPENPQAILHRCQIKPWGISTATRDKEIVERVTIRCGPSSFDLFMGGNPPTHNEREAYDKMKALPSTPFRLVEACKYFKCTTSDNGKAAQNRLVTLRKHGLVKATSHKPIIFQKTPVGLAFEKMMAKVLLAEKREKAVIASKT